MNQTNHDRVQGVLSLFKVGLAPFVHGAFREKYGAQADVEAAKLMGRSRLRPKGVVTDWDVAALLTLVWDAWGPVFRTELGQNVRTLVSELWNFRTSWAHQEVFSDDDAHRSADSAGRLLAAIKAPQRADVEAIRDELLQDLARAKGVRPTPGKVPTTQVRSPAIDPPAATSSTAGPVAPSPPVSGLYRCPIPGCRKKYQSSRGGWDMHVASYRMHPGWYPDVVDGDERKRHFKEDFLDWFA